MITSYKELTVWQRAMELVAAVYKLTNYFPKEEMYGLTAQIRRSAVSIPANIAEGRCRGTKKDYLQFLRIAYGSGAELETHLEIAKRTFEGDSSNSVKVNSLLGEVMRMLNVMIRKFNPKS